MKTKFIEKITKKIKDNLKIIFFAMKHPRTPWYAKLTGSLVLLYALSPIDLIPDFIPVIGFLDDLIIVPAGLYLVLLMIPEEVVKEIRLKARKTPLKAKSNPLGVLLIVAIWIFTLIMAVSLLVNNLP
ncbi:MAG: YkvA family protein [Candidatus Firestonebacteria bacterium]